MDVQKELNKIVQKIDNYHAANQKRANLDRFTNLAYILWGFSLATTGLAVVSPHPATIIIAVLFVIGGFASLRYSRKFGD